MHTIIAALLLSQCSGGYCPSPTYVAAPSYTVARPVQPALERHTITHEGLKFVVHGVKGSDGAIEWFPDDSFNARSYAAAEAAAEAPKPAAAKTVSAPAIKNFGLSPSMMGIGHKEYVAHSDEARRFIEEAKGEDASSALLHVTVIGTDAECLPVLNDLKTNPALVGLKDKIVTQDYRPGEWAVSTSLGFQNQGKPTIMIQTAKGPSDPKGGKVVYRAMSYEAGPEALAEAIRKADPIYNPSLDPGPGKSGGGCPLGFNSAHNPAIVIVAIGLLLLVIHPKRSPLS